MMLIGLGVKDSKPPDETINDNNKLLNKKSKKGKEKGKGNKEEENVTESKK